MHTHLNRYRNQAGYRNLLGAYLSPQRPAVILLATLLIGKIGLQLLNPQIMRGFIDAALAGGAPQVLFNAALLFLAVAFSQQLISILATYLSENVGWRATNALRSDLVDHCLRLDLAFHTAHTPGEMIERLDSDVTALSNFFSQFIIQLLGNALLLLGVLVMLFREDWRVGLALAVFALLTLLILARLRNLATPYWKIERQVSAELFGFLEERLAGTTDIRSSGANDYVLGGFYRLVKQWMHKTLQAGLLNSAMVNTTVLLLTAGPAIGLAVGAYLYQQEALTIGAIYLIFYYSGMLTLPINNITMQLQDLQRAGASVSRVQELLETPSQVMDSPLPTQVAYLPVARPQAAGSSRHALALAFQNVSFSYSPTVISDNGEPAPPALVLQDLSFQLQAGEVLGLLGRTGSGKTTLARLLFRFYDPQRGVICLGPQGALADLHSLPLAALRRQVGLVTQDIQLFHASVRDNLTFFDASLPDEFILQVIEELGLGNWYDTLPQGLDTLLMSGSGGLSAGEAQLLAFGRVFLQDPGLVILDEASSRLDPATELLVERAVDRLLQDRTAIIIAHRLSTVQRAGKILILEAGRLLEYGPRLALSADPASRFAQLLRTGLAEVLA